MFNLAATLESLYTIEYQQWHMLSIDDIETYVRGGLIGKDAFKRITGQDFPEETGDSNAKEDTSQPD